MSNRLVDTSKVQLSSETTRLIAKLRLIERQIIAARRQGVPVAIFQLATTNNDTEPVKDLVFATTSAASSAPPQQVSPAASRALKCSPSTSTTSSRQADSAVKAPDSAPEKSSPEVPLHALVEPTSSGPTAAQFSHSSERALFPAHAVTVSSALAMRSSPQSTSPNDHPLTQATVTIARALAFARPLAGPSVVPSKQPAASSSPLSVSDLDAPLGSASLPLHPSSPESPPPVSTKQIEQLAISLGLPLDSRASSSTFHGRTASPGRSAHNDATLSARRISVSLAVRKEGVEAVTPTIKAVLPPGAVKREDAVLRQKVRATELAAPKALQTYSSWSVVSPSAARGAAAPSTATAIKAGRSFHPRANREQVEKTARPASLAAVSSVAFSNSAAPAQRIHPDATSFLMSTPDHRLVDDTPVESTPATNCAPADDSSPAARAPAFTRRWVARATSLRSMERSADIEGAHDGEIFGTEVASAACFGELLLDEGRFHIASSPAAPASPTELKSLVDDAVRRQCSVSEAVQGSVPLNGAPVLRAMPSVADMKLVLLSDENASDSDEASAPSRRASPHRPIAAPQDQELPPAPRADRCDAQPTTNAAVLAATPQKQLDTERSSLIITGAASIAQAFDQLQLELSPASVGPSSPHALPLRDVDRRCSESPDSAPSPSAIPGSEANAVDSDSEAQVYTKLDACVTTTSPPEGGRQDHTVERAATPQRSQTNSASGEAIHEGEGGRGEVLLSADASVVRGALAAAGAYTVGPQIAAGPPDAEDMAKTTSDVVEAPKSADVVELLTRDADSAGESEITGFQPPLQLAMPSSAPADESLPDDSTVDEPPPDEEALRATLALLTGSLVLLKHGRKGWPHKRIIWVDATHAELLLCWGKPEKGIMNLDAEAVLLTSVVGIHVGQWSAVMKRSGRAAKESCYLSLELEDLREGWARTLDLEAESQSQRDWLAQQLSRLLLDDSGLIQACMLHLFQSGKWTPLPLSAEASSAVPQEQNDVRLRRARQDSNDD